MVERVVKTFESDRGIFGVILWDFKSDSLGF